VKNRSAFLLALCLIVLVACSSPLPKVAADCGRGLQIPVMIDAVDTANMVKITGEPIHAISMAKAFGDLFEVYSDPGLTRVIDNRVPSCAAYLVSEKKTNSKGVEVAYVLRVLKINGVLWGNWELSGYMEAENLRPISDSQRSTLTSK